MTEPARYHDEERLAKLLSELREPPRAWIEAAKEIPAARGEIDGIVERALADEEFRSKVLSDLDEILELEGHEPTRQRAAALRAGISQLKQGG